MSDEATAAFERGKAYFDKEDYESAEREFSSAVHLEPGNAEFHAWLGRVYSVQENSAKALEKADLALQLDPKCAMAYVVRGREQEDNDLAIDDCSRAIVLDPQYADAYNRNSLIRAIRD